MSPSRTVVASARAWWRIVRGCLACRRLSSLPRDEFTSLPRAGLSAPRWGSGFWSVFVGATSARLDVSLEVFRHADDGFPACSQETSSARRCPAELRPTLLLARPSLTSRRRAACGPDRYVKTPRLCPPHHRPGRTSSPIRGSHLRWTRWPTLRLPGAALSSSLSRSAQVPLSAVLCLRVPADVVGSARYWRVAGPRRTQASLVRAHIRVTCPFASADLAG